MPLYDYECRRCRHRFELLRRPTDYREALCPSCGEGEPRILILTAPLVDSFKAYYSRVFDCEVKNRAERKALMAHHGLEERDTKRLSDGMQRQQYEAWWNEQNKPEEEPDEAYCDAYDRIWAMDPYELRHKIEEHRKSMTVRTEEGSLTVDEEEVAHA